MDSLIAGQVAVPEVANAARVSRAAAAAQAGTSSTTTYTYDETGNMLSRSLGSTVDRYRYDAENRLVSATLVSGSQPGAVSYTYDADGLRTSKTVNGVTTQYLLGKNGPLPQVIAETTGATTVTYTYGLDLLNQSRPGTGPSFYVFDGQGSTRQLTSAAGLVTDTYTFDAFGNLLASTGSTPNLYHYDGQQLDPNLGFYYLRARYYMQAIGRLTSEDPFGGLSYDPASLHRYLYANADPVNNHDPSGLSNLIEVNVAFTIVSVLIGTAIGAGIGYLSGGKEAILTGAVIGFFIGLFVSTVGRSILLSIGRKKGWVEITEQTIKKPVKVGEAGGKKVRQTLNPGTKQGGKHRGVAALPFLPEAEQQPAADELVADALAEDPEISLVILQLLIGFLDDALTTQSTILIGSGPASLRPYIEDLFDMLREATPPGPVPVQPET